jgi:hypothetical protein
MANRLAGFAAALLGLAFAGPADAGSSGHGQEAALAGVFDECGKTGYGVTACPDFGARKERPRPAPQLEMRYELPQDECVKAGYGAVMCPNYGKEEAARPDKPANQKVKGIYEPPKDECGKSGWGITACPGFGSRK